jgi:hypothetical protein
MRTMRAVLYTRVSSDDQTQERRALLETISTTMRKRAKFQEMAAELITLSELEERLGGLEETRQATAERLTTLEARLGRFEELEQDVHDFVARYSALVGGAVETAIPEKRRCIYRALGARARPMPGDEAEVDLPIFEGENGKNSVRMGDQCS